MLVVASVKFIYLLDGWYDSLVSQLNITAMHLAIPSTNYL